MREHDGRRGDQRGGGTLAGRAGAARKRIRLLGLALAAALATGAGPAPRPTTPPAPAAAAAPQPGNAGIGQAAIDPARLQAAHEMLAAMKAEDNAAAMFRGLRGVLTKNIAEASEMPEPRAEGIVDEILMPHIVSQTQSFADMLARIQASVYTADEMREITAFYLSPVGRRVVEATPKIGAMSFAAGQEWSRRVTTEAIAANADELRKKGVKL